MHLGRILGMTKARKVALMVGAGVAVVAVSAGITSAILRFPPQLFSAHVSHPVAAKVCTTIATDPNPPLRVRSSPVVASDNIVGRLGNGTRMTVVDENQGWLRINTPISGWVYKALTVTSCVSATTASEPDTGKQLANSLNILAEATEQYHAGHLSAAIALAQTIPPSSSSYTTAQTAISQWRRDWKTAENDYYSAQKALREGNWQAVLQTVRDYPDNRFWRSKLTPLARKAIEQTQSTAQK